MRIERSNRNTSGDVFHLLVLVLGVALIVLAAGTGSSVMLFGAVAMFCLAFLIMAMVAISHGADISLFLLAPTAMSALQNIYLSPVSERLTEGALQVAVVTNFICSLLLLLGTLLVRGSEVSGKEKKVATLGLVVLIGLTIYGAATMIMFGNNIVGGIASARNLTAPFVFFLLGYFAAVFADLRRYMRLLLRLGWIVLGLALAEYLVPNFWPTIGLHHLWELKGIQVTPGSLLPQNFYASEQIVEGEFLRRMAGPFADPVNFGTFLFALAVVAWFLRSRMLFLLTVGASVLTVSKGAFLGLLTFAAVGARKFRSTFEFLVALVVVLGAAIYFYGFTQTSSTGSTTAHINGLAAAFVELPQHPFGRGFGGTGVLVGLFADEGAESGSAILESGLGMVIGQLGVLGLVGYVVFFIALVRAINRIFDVRQRVLGLSLVLAFALNAMFNEVALSPNSCAVYFILLGLLVAGLRGHDQEFDSSNLRPVSQRKRSQTSRFGV